MTYDLSHNILSKNQTHQFGSVIMEGDPVPTNAPHAATSYNLAYEDYAEGTYDAGGYGYVQPHAPRVITEYLPDYTDDPGDPRVKRKMIDYDANGNQMEIREQVSDPEQPLGYKEVALRRHLWDEEDRLLGVDLNPEADPDKPEVAVYTYDAGGERSIRYIPGRFDAYYSAKEAGKNHRLEAILYPNSLVTVKTLPLPEDFGEIENVTISKYTKHYYIGSERVASALGSIKSLGLLCEQIGADAALIQTMNEKVQITAEIIRKVYDTFEKDLELTAPYIYGTEYLRCDLTHYQDMYHPYWYHPDHLGSSSYITNLSGEVNQHLEYLPFGELLVEEHLNSYNSPFLFNAYELDRETSNYYVSARYYNPKWSMWLSPDPLAGMFPSWSPYNYVLQNPVNLSDPTGLCPECPDNANNGDIYNSQGGETYIFGDGKWTRQGGELAEVVVTAQKPTYENYKTTPGVSIVPQDVIDRSYRELETARRGAEIFTLPDFSAANYGLTYDQIIGQEKDKSFTSFGSQPGGPEIRYIRDPLVEGVVIDLRHMLYIGRKGPFVGNTVEMLQALGGDPSGGDFQDAYSNFLGYQFYHFYGKN